MVAAGLIEVPRAGPDSSVAAWTAHLLAVSVAQLAAVDGGVVAGDVDCVHRYRVATRRLRCHLSDFKNLLPEGPNEAMRSKLHELSCVVGVVRDLDVLALRLAERACGLPDVDRPAARDLAAYLAQQRLQAHTQLVEMFRCTAHKRLVDSLVEFAAQPWGCAGPDASGAKQAERMAIRLTKRRWKALAIMVSQAGEAPSDEQLHEIRVAAKRCIYAAQAAVIVVGKPAQRFAQRLEVVKTVLGEHQNGVFAEAWLRASAQQLTECRLVIGEYMAAEKIAMAKARADWPAAWETASRRQARRWLD